METKLDFGRMCGLVTLTSKTFFARLHSLSLNKGQKVEEVGMWEVSTWRWNLRWRRVRFEWESLMEADLIMHISRANMSREEKDIQVWRCDETGLFSVNSAYECLAKQERGPVMMCSSTCGRLKCSPM